MSVSGTSKVTSLLSSSLGKKAVMGVSGLLLAGFVLVHMAGNLKMYLGAQAFNAYAEGLRSMGSPMLPHGGALWLARLVLLAAVVAHLVSAWLVTQRSRAARGGAYVRHNYVRSDYAVRTMRWGGVILLLFIVYHLLHLTLGTVHPDFRAGDAFHNVVEGFQNPWVCLFYIAANLALGLHLFHGVWSSLQSLGANHPRYNRWRETAAALVAFVVTAGNLSFPIAVLTGIVH